MTAGEKFSFLNHLTIYAIYTISTIHYTMCMVSFWWRIVQCLLYWGLMYMNGHLKGNKLSFILRSHLGCCFFLLSQDTWSNLDSLLLYLFSRENTLCFIIMRKTANYERLLPVVDHKIRTKRISLFSSYFTLKSCENWG